MRLFDFDRFFRCGFNTAGFRPAIGTELRPRRHHAATFGADRDHGHPGLVVPNVLDHPPAIDLFEVEADFDGSGGARSLIGQHGDGLSGLPIEAGSGHSPIAARPHLSACCLLEGDKLGETTIVGIARPEGFERLVVTTGVHLFQIDVRHRVGGRAPLVEIGNATADPHDRQHDHRKAAPTQATHPVSSVLVGHCDISPVGDFPIFRNPRVTEPKPR